MSRALGVANKGSPIPSGAALWTPALPTTDGGVLPHTWHYPGPGNIFQDAASTIPAVADGDPIGASWNQGSDVHIITQPVAGNRPTLRLGVLNGQPVFRFDGTDFLQAAFAGVLSQPYTIFIVVQLALAAVDDNTTRDILDSDDAVNRMIVGVRGAATPDAWQVHMGANLIAGNTDALWRIWTVLTNGVASEIWFGGVSQVAGPAGAQNADGITLGADFAGNADWLGDKAESIIYDPNLSTADMNQVGNYLATKHGQAWTAIP